MDNKKRFDTWDNQIDCNDCEPYWTGQCDGVPIGKSRNCTAFKATRSIVIPERLNSLEKRVKWLEWVVGIGFIILGALVIIGR